MSAIQSVFDAERQRRRRILAAKAHKLVDFVCLAWSVVIAATGGDPTPVLLVWIGSSVAAIRRVVTRNSDEF
jgi:uncharacterized iron-regulated membrane protein